MTIFTLFLKVFTILAELQLLNARMVLEQENLRREKKGIKIFHVNLG